MSILAKLSLVELLAALTGFIAIYFQIKAKPIYWPVSIINVLLYMFVFFQAKLYAEIMLQIYYLAISIYGWIFWTKSNHLPQAAISRCSLHLLFILFIAFIILWIVMAYLLKNYTNTDVPYIDSFITSLSFIATYMLARKKIENWLIWIFVDAISIGLYFYKGLYLTILLFAVLTILAIIGYLNWRKRLYATT